MKQHAIRFATTTGAALSLSFITLTWVSPVFGQDANDDKKRGGSPHDYRKPGKRGPGPDRIADTEKTGIVRMGPRAIRLPAEFRTITGANNNVENPEWGSAEIPFVRISTPDYADGVDFPSGNDRPNARAISNAVMAQEDVMYNKRGITDFLWQWGQFLDHDITLTPVDDPVVTFDIEVPTGDPFFDPQGTGTQIISLDRSFAEPVDGVREQLNEITAYIDASNVYGSDVERAEELRTMDGTGKLKTSDGDLLPFNVNGLPNAPSDQAANFFLAGDFRANEQIGLTALHTLFVREHNYWADVIKKGNSTLTGDQVYEAARIIVGAEMQVITYREFLPLLLGPRALPPYRGYREDVNSGIGNVFATAGYRFGHTMLASELVRIDRFGEEIEAGNIDLAGAFFNPSALTDEGGIAPLLRGLARQPAQQIDTKLVDDVRNFLFGPPGSGGFDLASLNIQRGRDHGLASYNQVRADYGLVPAVSFADITSDTEVQEDLASIYPTVDQVDVWVGGLAEDPVRGALLGETMSTILRDQFIRLRDGDRFWYQNYLDRELQSLVERQTLAQIIRRNTEIGREIQDNVFITTRGPFISHRPKTPRHRGHEPPRGGKGSDKKSRPRSR
ncbi:MAG: peroxidase family protein [Verrucomicrobiales bacterium]|nr:peroxidase family protein [Verrucomicrobiales bacterium]